MPEDVGDRTEPPTPRRRQEARSKGEVARSQDLSAATLLLASIITLSLLGPGLWTWMLSIMQTSLNTAHGARGEIPALASGIAGEMFTRIGLFMAILIAVILATLYSQVGWLITGHPLKPDLNRLNPIKGVQRMFSARSAVMLVINLAKLAVVSGVTYLTVRQYINEIIFAFAVHHTVLVRLAGHLAFRLGINLAVLLLVLAVFDFIYQRYRREKDLRMTKEEIKEEMRRMEGDPVMKRRRREVQRQLAFRRLQQDVPQADVVVTNPTHYAIAIKYDAEEMPAPKVVAKGADLMAQRIREIAADVGIPIVERPSLVRLMYQHVKVGDTIPEQFYQAIAEILAYIYELSGKSRAMRRATEGEPALV